MALYRSARSIDKRQYKDTHEGDNATATRIRMQEVRASATSGRSERPFRPPPQPGEAQKGEARSDQQENPALSDPRPSSGSAQRVLAQGRGTGPACGADGHTMQRIVDSTLLLLKPSSWVARPDDGNLLFDLVFASGPPQPRTSPTPRTSSTV